MNDYSFLMDKAKAMLSGKWLQAALVTLAYTLLLGVVSGIGGSTDSKILSGIGFIIQMAAYGPLTFGYILYLACLVDTNTNNFELLFRGFNRFVDTFLAGLLFYLAVCIGCALLIVPGVIAFCGLSMTFFIMVDDANISGIDALKMSWNLMNGHKMEFFVLQLHFIGWAILAVLTCGIGFFWLTPYIYTTNLNFYRRLRYGA